MAPKFLAGRPRANTAEPSVSSPTFTSTNAASRSDLRPLNHQPSNRAGRSKTFAAIDEEPHRDHSPPQHHRLYHRQFRHHHPHQQLQQHGGSREHTTLRKIPHDHYRQHQHQHQQENGAVGVALGSPSEMSWPQPPVGTPVQPRAADVMGSAGAATATPWDPHPDPTFPPANGPSSGLQRKESTWKKIGNLFRAKTEPAPSTDDPVYEAPEDTQWLHGRGPSGDSISSPVDPSTGKQRSHSVPQTAQRHGRREPKRKDRKTRANKLTKEPTDPGPGSRRHWGAWAEEPVHDLAVPTAGTKQPTFTPLLNVEIPEVEMERYSVMFANLLGNQSSTSLRARRSKHLETLEPHPEVDEPKHDPLTRERRPTPSTGSKSPSFTLFPPPAAMKAPKAVKPSPTAPTVPSSLQKSHTLPVSPSRTSWDAPTTIPEKPPKSPNSVRHDRWDSEVSYLDTTASDSDSLEDDDDDDGPILLQTRPDREVDVRAEPTWEIVGPANTFVERPARGQSPLARLKKEVNSPNFKAPSPQRPSKPEQQQQRKQRKRQQQGPQPLPLEALKSPPQHAPPPAPPTRGPPPAPVHAPTPRTDSLRSPFPPRKQSRPAFPPPRSSSNTSHANQANTYPPHPSVHPTTSASPPPPPPQAGPTSPKSPDIYIDEHDSVEISVARSVSVSKRQRKHLVVPADSGQSESDTGGTDHEGAGPGTDINGCVSRPGVGGGEDGKRVLEKRVGGTLTVEALQKGHAYRKSEDAVIESA